MRVCLVLDGFVVERGAGLEGFDVGLSEVGCRLVPAPVPELCEAVEPLFRKRTMRDSHVVDRSVGVDLRDVGGESHREERLRIAHTEVFVEVLLESFVGEIFHPGEVWIFFDPH